MNTSKTSIKSEALLIYEKLNTVHSGQDWCHVKVTHQHST